MKRRRGTENLGWGNRPGPAAGTGWVPGYSAGAEEAARAYWKLSRSRLRIIRIVGFLAIAAIAAAVLFALGIIPTGRSGNGFQVTEFRLKDIGELATEAASLSVVQPVEAYRKVGPFELSGSRTTYHLQFSLAVKAGLDFDQIVLHVDPGRHVITVTMPEVRILEGTDAYLSGRSDNMNPLTQLQPEEIEGARDAVMKKAENIAAERGILEKAKENAERLISGLLAGGYDMSVFKVEYQWP